MTRNTTVNSNAAQPEPAWDATMIDVILEEHKNKPGALLPLLHAIQNQLGYVPEASKAIIAKALHLSTAEVHGVVTFYHHFRSQPPGNHIVQVCLAESCQAMGGRGIESYVKQTLGVDFNQTTLDGEFTLEPVYCLGNCACSPSIRIDNDVYGEVDKPMIDTLINHLLTRTVEVK